MRLRCIVILLGVMVFLTPRAAVAQDFHIYLPDNELGCDLMLATLCGGQSRPGGFWPHSTSNVYMYNSGVQVVGVIPAAPGCSAATRTGRNSPDCFRWSGDTAGIIAFDPRGPRTPRRSLSGIFDAGNPQDLAAWPSAGSIEGFPEMSAYVTDTAIFHPSLIGRKTVSGNDAWGVLWDPVGIGISQYGPMGIAIEQRTLQWDFPAGNEATIFQILTLTNITDSRPFQVAIEAMHFGGGDSLPDAVWRYDSMYFAFAADPDVGAYTDDYLTAVLPFNAMIAYDAAFTEDGMTYPPEQFHPPFFGRSPGIISMQLLNEPLANFTTFTSGGAFPVPTPSDRARTWRTISRNRDPAQGDSMCNIESPPLCFLLNVPTDTRGLIATNPFSLAPGESKTSIIAISVGASVATPLVTPGSDNKPGIPTAAPGCNGEEIRPIEVAAGYVAPRTCPAPGQPLDRRDVETVPGSVLGKAAVAQAVVDNGFVMPSPPAAPAFALVPGDNSVTVVWDASATDAEGDAYAAVAGDPLSPLYDPNFRQDDLEGYRIYRGTTPSSMTLIAQFDRTDTEFVDSRCVLDESHADGEPCDTTETLPLSYRVIQHRSITRAPNGTPIILRADTAFAGPQPYSQLTRMRDSGIPYGFVDTDVQNGFQYFYKVTAFDFNSILSGPSSLESSGQITSIVPRAVSSAVHPPQYTAGLAGRGFLPEAQAPAFDETTGTFAGPQPPTAGFTGSFDVYAAHLLQGGAHEIRIDSVVPGHYSTGVVATYHLTADGQPLTAIFSDDVRSGSSEQIDLPGVLLKAEEDRAAAYERRGVASVDNVATLDATLSMTRPYYNSLHADWASKRFPPNRPPRTAWVGGSRWFDGQNEQLPDPAYGLDAHGELDGMVIFQPDPWRNVDHYPPDADAVAAPLAPYPSPAGTLSDSHLEHFYHSVLGLTRAADVRLYWSAAGTVDSVIDITHDVPVPFSTAVRASYGFLADNDGNGRLTYGDFYYLENALVGPAASLSALRRPLLTQPAIMPVDIDGNLQPDAAGFGLYINGEPWLFRGPLPRAGAWTLRTYHGAITRDTAGLYSFQPQTSNPAVPGLRYRVEVRSPAMVVNADADLSKVHAVPDPYYGRSAFDGVIMEKAIHFVNLPPRATLRIYTMSGVLVKTIVHDDATGGGQAAWDLRTPNGSLAASAVYYFHIATPEGRSHVGRFTIVNVPN